MPNSFRMYADAERRMQSIRGVRNSQRRVAEKMQRNAQDLAPDHGPGITGRYNDSLKVVDRGAEFHVVADVSYAAAIEAKYNTLGRAMHP